MVMAVANCRLAVAVEPSSASRSDIVDNGSSGSRRGDDSDHGSGQSLGLGLGPMYQCPFHRTQHDTKTVSKMGQKIVMDRNWACLYLGFRPRHKKERCWTVSCRTLGKYNYNS